MLSLESKKKRFLSEPTIDSQLPLTMPYNGLVEEFCGQCPSCDRTTKNENLRGIVSKSVPHVANIDAIGCCMDCLIIFVLHVRVRSQEKKMTMEYISNDGRWVSVNSEPVGLLAVIKTKLTQCLSLLKLFDSAKPS